MAKTAMAKDPTTPETTKRGNWKYKGRWVNKDGFLVDNYGKVLPNQKNAFVPAKQNPFTTKSAADKKKEPTPEERIEKGLPSLVAGGIERAQEFDPTKFYQQYQPAFEEGRQREYERLYGAFERQSAEQFGREQQQLEQSLVERGLDPSGEAYKSLKENLYKSQEAARQNARDAAMSGANALQQQFYGQATGSAMLPSQLQQPFLNIYSDTAQRQWAEQEAERQRKFQERLARMGGGGGGGGTNALNQQLGNMIISQYTPQPQQPSALNTGITSAGQAIGSAIIGNMYR